MPALLQLLDALGKVRDRLFPDAGKAVHNGCHDLIPLLGIAQPALHDAIYRIGESVYNHASGSGRVCIRSAGGGVPGSTNGRASPSAAMQVSQTSPSQTLVCCQ